MAFSLRSSPKSFSLPFAVTSNSPFCAVLSAENVRFRWNVLSSYPGSAAIIRAGKNVATGLACRDRDQDQDEELLGWESPTEEAMDRFVDLAQQQGLQYVSRSL